jgi:hypothetical protein
LSPSRPIELERSFAQWRLTLPFAVTVLTENGSARRTEDSAGVDAREEFVVVVPAAGEIRAGSRRRKERG